MVERKFKFTFKVVGNGDSDENPGSCTVNVPLSATLEPDNEFGKKTIAKILHVELVNLILLL